MACFKRDKMSMCGHYQCPHREESGFQCVDVAFGGGRGWCEAGKGCVERCGYSWRSDALDAKANEAFATQYGDGN